MLAVDAAVDAGGFVGQAEDLGQLLLGGGDAPGVAAGEVVPQPPDGGVYRRRAGRITPQAIFMPESPAGWV